MNFLLSSLSSTIQTISFASIKHLLMGWNYFRSDRIHKKITLRDCGMKIAEWPELDVFSTSHSTTSSQFYVRIVIDGQIFNFISRIAHKLNDYRAPQKKIIKLEKLIFPCIELKIISCSLFTMGETWLVLIEPSMQHKPLCWLVHYAQCSVAWNQAEREKRER